MKFGSQELISLSHRWAGNGNRRKKEKYAVVKHCPRNS